MAALCHFFRMPPSDYWALDGDELAALARYRNEHIEAQKQQQNRG